MSEFEIKLIKILDKINDKLDEINETIWSVSLSDENKLSDKD